MVVAILTRHISLGRQLSTRMRCRSRKGPRGDGAPSAAHGMQACTAQRLGASPSTSWKEMWCAGPQNRLGISGEDAACRYTSTTRASSYPSKRGGLVQRDSQLSSVTCTVYQCATTASSYRNGSRRMTTSELMRSQGRTLSASALGPRIASRAPSSAPTRHQRLSRLGARIQCLHVWRSCD